MSATKNSTTKKPRRTAGKSTRHTATAERPALAFADRLRKPLKDVVADARENSHEFALAGLGMFAQMKKEREARMAAFIEEGKRVEPKLRKAFEEWKTSIKPPRIDAAAVRRFFEQRGN
jgi:hypothetical protein